MTYLHAENKTGVPGNAQKDPQGQIIGQDMLYGYQRLGVELIY
jgi:hypothetical protein